MRKRGNPMRPPILTRTQAGFSMLETVVAIAVLAVGVLTLAATLADCLAYMDVAQYDYIAQQEAAKTIESIFTARDMGQATWATICNVGAGPSCIFTAGATKLCNAGPDGILGTTDDNCTIIDSILRPGADGTFAAPVSEPLSTYTRTIVIAPVAGVANLNSITVTINYQAGRFFRRYVLTTNISNFS